MSSREEQVMALARRAWQAGQPSDEEVEAGAQRVARRMRTSARPRSFRRPAVALAFAVVFIGALAYAANGGGGWFGGSAATKGTPSPVKSAVRAGLGGISKPLERMLQAAPPTGVTPELAPEGDAPTAKVATPASSASALALGAKRAPSAAGAASSWREVDEALDARDDARAKTALEGLGKADDAATRAKAKLGLAQLARARGDCATARRLALEVTTAPGADVALVKRAQAIVLACD